MKAIKGPAVFLAQFAGDAPPFNSLPAIADWAARLGFKGVQIPSWDRRLFDLEKAAESQTYCDEVRGVLAERGLQVTELSTHLGANWSPCILPTTPRLTDSRLLRC